MAVRRNLRYSWSYRDLEELLAERGMVVVHVTLFRWVHQFTPELIDAARWAGTWPVIAGWSTRPYVKVRSEAPKDGRDLQPVPAEARADVTAVTKTASRPLRCQGPPFDRRRLDGHMTQAFRTSDRRGGESLLSPANPFG